VQTYRQSPLGNSSSSNSAGIILGGLGIGFGVLANVFALFAFPWIAGTALLFAAVVGVVLASGGRAAKNADLGRAAWICCGMSVFLALIFSLVLGLTTWMSFETAAVIVLAILAIGIVLAILAGMYAWLRGIFAVATVMGLVVLLLRLGPAPGSPELRARSIDISGHLSPWTSYDDGEVCLHWKLYGAKVAPRPSDSASCQEVFNNFYDFRDVSYLPGAVAVVYATASVPAVDDRPASPPTAGIAVTDKIEPHTTVDITLASPERAPQYDCRSGTRC